MMLRATRVLALCLLTGCVLERGERSGGIGQPVPSDPNAPTDPNGCSCTTMDPSNVDFNGVTEVTIDGFDGTIDLDANATKPSIGWHLRGDVTVSVDRNGSTLGVHAHKPSLCVSCGIDFDVHLPAGLDVKLSTSNGEIHCGGTVRSLTASTSNAKVGLLSLAGTFAISTSNGAVDADDLSPSGDCTISTSNGSITVTKLHAKPGQKIEGTTSNADVCVSLDGFTVEKSSDHFTATSCGADTGSLVLDTSNGSICVSNL